MINLVQSTLTSIQTPNVPWRDNCHWRVKLQFDWRDLLWFLNILEFSVFCYKNQDDLYVDCAVSKSLGLNFLNRCAINEDDQFEIDNCYVIREWWYNHLELIIHKITKNYKKRLPENTRNNTLHIIWAEESPQFYFAVTTAFQQVEFKQYLKRAMTKLGF